MITKPIFIRTSMGSPSSGIVFEQALNDMEIIQEVFSIYYNFTKRNGYGGYYEVYGSDVEESLVYDNYHSGRYHFLFQGLKYYPNISDLWYMNAVLTGNRSGATPVLQKILKLVSQQSFANINLGFDAMYLAMNSLVPVGKTVLEGRFDPSEPGIRLVMFVDKLDLVERTVTGGKKVNNLQFHYTIKSYLIDPTLGGQYSDFTTTALIGQKSFYYEQTIPTYTRPDFSTPASLKTGWGHFLYAAVTDDKTPIKYVQLRDALKTIYNGFIFAQGSDNASIKVDSSSLLDWLNTDITLRNATTEYEPSSVNPINTKPTFPFTDSNSMDSWLASVALEASNRGRPDLDFLMSYDNMYWEPLADTYSGDVYSNSPAIFMTRLTTYYQGTGTTPVDEPGNFDKVGGYPKQRRKYFLSYLIQQLIANLFSDTKEELSPYFVTENPERFLGPKFFPFYKFIQYKDDPSEKELLDLVTVPFSGPETSVNVIQCETSQSLKRVVSDDLNPYRKKIITKPEVLPSSLGSTTTERINSVGFVSYRDNDGRWDTITLDVQAVESNKRVFSFLTWIFANPYLLTGLREWTRRGRYLIQSQDLEIGPSPWKGNIDLCETMQSGMYATPEEAYKEYKRVNEGIYVTSDPSPTDPQWKDYFACLPAVETIETTTEYCDPSPDPEGRKVVKLISKQRVSIAANGTRANIGPPVNEFPTTTFVLKNQQRVVNGNTVLGDKTVVYQNCSETYSKFEPYKTTGSGTGPKPNVNVGTENFINPAVFNVNPIKLVPSLDPIPLTLDNCYYVFEFDDDNLGNSSSDYTILLSPGKRGQVVILEVRTLGTPYTGILLKNGSTLTSNSANQKVWLDSETWGDGGGQRFKSFLFMIFDGNNWVEFMRRDIY